MVVSVDWLFNRMGEGNLNGDGRGCVRFLAAKMYNNAMHYVTVVSAIQVL
jgi:hypothetical protein